MPFSKEYLEDYEKTIRTLPLEDLYDIISMIRDHPFNADDTPERVRIVEKRIIELENEPVKQTPAEELNEKLEEQYQNKSFRIYVPYDKEDSRKRKRNPYYD